MCDLCLELVKENSMCDLCLELVKENSMCVICVWNWSRRIPCV